jgi:energy-coupling factor transport system ATP-binding protein
MKQAVSVRDLGFRYPDYPQIKFPVLFRKLELDLYGGEIGLVLGAPETGKTTLSRILTGLIPRHTGGTLEGEISLLGEDIGRIEPFELIDRVGLIFQNPDEQIITTRSDIEIAFALESLGLDRETMTDRVDQALATGGISHLRKRNPATLSDGEKKKLLFACLCAIDPEVFVLDETFEEIDPPSRAQMLEHLKRTDKTVLLLSSKWLDVYADVADRLYLLSDRGCTEAEKRESAGDGSFFAGPFSKKCEEAGILVAPRGDASLLGYPDRRGRDPILEAEGISFRYAGNEDFNLEIDRLAIQKQEIVSIIGRNGSGKSTLGKVLSGLLTTEAGSIRIEQKGRFVEAERAQLNRTVAYMFQNPDLQIFLPTVEEELAYGLRRQGVEAEEVSPRITEAIERFELPEASIPPAIMSFGARKRLQAAVYYLLQRPLLVLDEADSGLSLQNLFRMIKIFADQHRSIVLITHDIRLATSISNRVLLMERGRIKAVADRPAFQSLMGRMEQTES